MEFKNTLKNTVSIASVVEELGGLNLERCGTTLLGPCPTGHSSSSGKCFGVNTRENYFNCFNCGIGGDIFDLIKLVNATDFKGALAWINDHFQPAQLLKEPFSTTLSCDNSFEQFHQKAELYELIFKWGKQLLYEPRAEQEINYLLEQRGYTLENLQKTEWFYVPPDKEIRSFLCAVAPQAEELIMSFKNFKLQGYYGDIFRLALPYRNREGLITGFIKRASCKEGYSGTTWNDLAFHNQRYDSVFHTAHERFKKYDLFNLHACIGKRVVVITEGVADAAYLSTLNLVIRDKEVGFAAVGQGRLSHSHKEGLEALGIKKVIICFDNDKQHGISKATGLVNTRAALDFLASTSLEIGVIDPRLLEPYKDPEEFVCARGSTAFEKLISEALDGASWQAQERIGEADNQASGLFSGQVYLSTQVPRPAHDSKASINPFYTFDELIADICSMPTTYKTGFAPLDEIWSIPNAALTVIAGRPGHGKTSFLLNMYLQLIAAYPEQSFFFFSYEVTRKQLLLNALNALTNREFSSHFNAKAIQTYLIDGSKTSGDLEAYAQLEFNRRKLEQYIQSERMGVVHEHLYVDELVEYLKYLKDTYPVGVIIIDYIQKIKIKGRFQSRQLELQKISEYLLEAALKLSLPLVLGAQLNREVTHKQALDAGRLREAGDIEQDANTVIGIWNEAKAQENQDIPCASRQKLELVILKNRDGRTGDWITLDFNGPTLALRAPQERESSYKHKSFY